MWICTIHMVDADALVVGQGISPRIAALAALNTAIDNQRGTSRSRSYAVEMANSAAHVLTRNKDMTAYTSLRHEPPRVSVRIAKGTTS